MRDPTFIDTPSGDQLVVLTRDDYDTLVNRLAAYEAAEDAADVELGESRLSEWEAEGRPAYPLAVVPLIRRGDSPLKAFRRFRKLTRHALAEKAGIDQAYLGDLEKGRRTASAELLAVLAAALDTTPASLQPLDI